MTNLPTADQERKLRFAEALNRHGYAFQNRILSIAAKLNAERQSRWVFEAAEFPVSVGNYGTRIDFVLWLHGTPWWMLAECKRVNPAFNDWLFVKTPYVRRNHWEVYTAERVVADTTVLRCEPIRLIGLPEENYYHIGFQVKSGKAGDPSGGRSEAIEDAATQVCRGTNGMVTYLSENQSALGPSKAKSLLPVIFTTAKLYVSDIDLAETDLETGEIDADKLDVRAVDYLYYQYNLSPGIKHGIPTGVTNQDLSSILAADVIRTIPIVTAAGVENFLRRFYPTNFTIDTVRSTPPIFS
jgi:hypothetical protein